MLGFLASKEEQLLKILNIMMLKKLIQCLRKPLKKDN